MLVTFRKLLCIKLADIISITSQSQTSRAERLYQIVTSPLPIEQRIDAAILRYVSLAFIVRLNILRLVFSVA